MEPTLFGRRPAGSHAGGYTVHTNGVQEPDYNPSGAIDGRAPDGAQHGKPVVAFSAP